MDKKIEFERLREFLKNKKKGEILTDITKALGWSKKMKKQNRAMLEEWVNLGKLVKKKGDKYTLVEESGYLQGVLDVVKNRFAFVDGPEFSVFVPRSKFNGAFNGDTVLVKVVDDGEENKKKEGEVVTVLERSSTKIIGIFEKSNNFGFVVPTHSFGKDVFIPNKFCKGIENKKLVVCEITFWGDKDKKPEGRIVDVLGDPFNTDVMIEALIERDGLSEEFSQEVLREVRSLKAPEGKYGDRKDLRDLNIITIDGADAKDLDDAVYVEKLANGKYRLIVSIADVSHYVPKDSALDTEAYKRGNSVYLVDRVIPMFPKELSNGLCSLNPNEDKFCFTCDMVINDRGKVEDYSIYKSVIKSVHRMTYDNVNKIIKGNEELEKEYADIKDMVFEMLELSRILREVKKNRGSIDFDLPEVKVVLDENNKVAYLKNRDRGESEKIIEDFMIAANETVAEHLFWMEVPSIYRTHEKPDMERIKALNESLEKFDYRIYNYEELHPGKFQKIIDDSADKGINTIIHKLILMSLKQARYTKENTGHFGLASTYYTHFTSPIRRYADLIVHRVLSDSLGGMPSKSQLKWYEKNLDEIGVHISKTERAAMKTEEESVKIKVTEYMMGKVGEVYKAKITGMNRNGIFMETEEHVEVVFNVIAAPGYYEYDERNLLMTERDSGEVYNIGDALEVMIVRADLRELVVEVVPYVEI